MCEAQRATTDSAQSSEKHGKICSVEELLSIPGLSEQLYATLAVALASFSAGVVQGWAAPTVEILMTSHSPLGYVLDKTATSPIVVIMLLSAIGNMMACGAFMDRYGRRAGCWYLNFFAPAGWAFLATAYRLKDIYFGAILIGSTTVSGKIVGVIYLSEITHDKIRGPCIALLMSFYSSGELASHLLAEFYGYGALNVVGFLVSLIFPFLFWRMPESPQYLILKNRVQAARESLSWYHGEDPHAVAAELDKLGNQRRKYKVADIKLILIRKGARRGLAVVIFLHVLSELIGTTVIELYTGVIIKENDNKWETSSKASVIIALIRFIASLINVFLVERFGRKISLALSITAMGVALTLLSGITALRDHEDGRTQFWGPFACLVWYTFSNQIFLASVEVISGEILSPDYKGLAMATAGTLKLLTVIITVQTYTGLQTVASYGYFVLETTFCLVGLVVVLLVIPETRGKTLIEIENTMDK